MSKASNSETEFSGLRGFLWPIHLHEMKKFLPLFLMFMFITFNYTFLRTSKDALVLDVGGPDMLSALKLYGVLPAAVIYTGYYAYLCNVFSKQNVFYYAIAPFVIFFCLYGCILHPYSNAFELHSLDHFLRSALPEHVLVRSIDKFNLLIYWPQSLYYIMSELWGSAVLSLLFWGFTNSITDIRQAKRFYALLGIGANVGLSITGPYVSFLKTYVLSHPANYIYALMATFMVTTAIIIALYTWMNVSVLADPSVRDSIQVKPKKKKAKLTIMESFNLLYNSKHLLCIAILVMAYGMSINLIEIIWKSQLKSYFTIDGIFSQSDYFSFTSKVGSATGLVSIFLMLFVSGQLERKLGWGVAALITPVSILVLGAVFFGMTLGQDFILQMGLEFIGNPIYIAILIGSAQNVLCKAAKYSLFDPTKEKAYFPLNDDEKTKGKAAIDVVGARLGKAGGAAVQQILITTVGGMPLPIISAVVFFIIGSWIVSALSLSKIISNYEEGLAEEDIPLSTQTPASPKQDSSPALA